MERKLNAVMEAERLIAECWARAAWQCRRDNGSEPTTLERLVGRLQAQCPQCGELIAEWGCSCKAETVE